MGDQSEIQGNFLRIPKNEINNLKNYQVLIGFSGFGNVGYLALTHIVETVKVESIAFWNNSSSWYHKGRLESLLTVYKHKESKTIIVLTRIPIHVSTVPQKYWDALVEEILNWRCKRYIIIGGLREDTRSPNSTEWAAYVTTTNWDRLYPQKTTLREHLTMIGPLSSFMTIGTAFQSAVLGLLAYCNYEEDADAAIVALSEIQKLCDIEIPFNKTLKRFNFSFIPNAQFPVVVDESEDTDNEDDLPGYDLNELI